MAVMTAQPRLSRRSLEKQGMTREQELELLIQEQAADDTYVVLSGRNEVSLDAVGEFLAVEEGQLLNFLPPTPPLIDPATIPHGTYRGYTRFECRCSPCRAANTEYRRQRRAGGKP